VGTYTQFSQGTLQQTGNALDLAIEGQGFFEVMTPQGMRWTRAGNFKVDGNGMLVTTQGHPVMAADEGGQAPEERTLIFTGNGELRITEMGEVFEGQNFVGRISVVQPQDQDAFQKVGNSYFDFRFNANPTLTAVDSPKLRSGFLESSNVNIVQEMTDMIATTRIFENTQKAISAYDGIADKLVNQVPKV
jgi:flagellar basal-body rod protein FlgG